MPQLITMDRTGDTKLIWSPAVDAEVENARRTFRDLKKAGHLAYKVNPNDGTKGEQILEFDPTAEKIIMAPPMRGG